MKTFVHPIIVSHALHRRKSASSWHKQPFQLALILTIPEESQLYYIENISSDINNYQKAINQIKRFDNNLSDSLQSEFDNLIDRMVEY